ncbi:MAG: ATP-binding protein [Bacteroidales bacterium]|jgi:AAA+ superfamily predicted ATPase|nr:ATP-binding protein [Bacteroidales bacterium]
MRILKNTQKQEKIDQTDIMSTPQTLLEHVERIIALAEKSELNEAFYKKAKTSINFVAKFMNLSTNQAIIFSVFMEKSDDSNITLSELSNFLGCRNIKTISMLNEMDELEKRRLVRCSWHKGKRNYRVPHDVVDAVKQGVFYEPESSKNLTTEQLFQHIERLFDERNNKEISYQILVEELKLLLKDNTSLVFCRQIKEWDNIYKNDDNFSLLLFFCHQFINLDHDCIWIGEIEKLYEAEKRHELSKFSFRRMKKELHNGSNELIKQHILEYYNDNRLVIDNEIYRITENAKEQLFAELDIQIKQCENKKGILLHDSITVKELFYNEHERMQIAQLSSLLQEDNFVNVQKRLEDNGMRKGFSCLFHGVPGTGKTETAYQIAHSTGRDIMMVDISETKSCWFGESEKKIKAIFERYRTHVKISNISPILLFNEADAVIGKRRDTENSNIAQTENAIQNIILQEMETFDGIMIATTNLIQNLDKAFERRFLYKIEFDKPSVETKKMIWLSMIPSLSEQEAEELATSYDFSGRQIENIVRKRTIDSILNGTEPSMKAMHSYCQNELLYKKERKIGFNL